MTKLQKLFFTSAAGLLLVASFALEVFLSPFTNKRWMFWLALGCALLLLFIFTPNAACTRLRERLVALPDARIAWTCMFTAFILDVLELILGVGETPFWTISRLSVVSILLMTCFAAMQLRVIIDWKKSAAIAAAIVVHIFCLLLQPDLFAVVVQLCCLFLLGIAGKGERRQKILYTTLSSFFFLLGLMRLLSSSSLQNHLKSSWLDPSSAPMASGYHLMQMHRAFEASGLWGIENPAVADRGFARLKALIYFNPLPSLSLHWGNIATAVCVALLLLLMALLLRWIWRQRNLRYRNVLLGLWGFVAFSQIWSLGGQFGLMPFARSYGTAFLGNGFMGCLILLLGVGCVMEPARSGDACQTRDRLFDKPSNRQGCSNHQP
jgi:cell division protein FtsW (lipid II flippase)